MRLRIANKVTMAGDRYSGYRKTTVQRAWRRLKKWLHLVNRLADGN